MPLITYLYGKQCYNVVFRVPRLIQPFCCQMHVHEDNKRGDMSGYVTTLPCSPPPDGDYGVYALDCEMVRMNDSLIDTLLEEM